MSDAYTQLKERCRSLVTRLRLHPLNGDSKENKPPPHATDENGQSTTADHLLTTAALVYCLAYDTQDEETLHLLRLAALVHDMTDNDQPDWVSDYTEKIISWVQFLREQGTLLNNDQHIALNQISDPIERLLARAHLAASRRRTIDSSFADHPLAEKTEDVTTVTLVYGGVTKVKGYIFESAKLPEIRGASVLLDHINRLDVPSFWGANFFETNDQNIIATQKNRCDNVRTWFENTMEHAPLDAPECVLYASGGNILALAPVEMGPVLADAIEQRYTEVTQVANSVGVSESFSLLELQYGRCPQEFWVDDAEKILSEESPAAIVLRQSLGIPDVKTTDRHIFWEKKGFGELVTVLAMKANRRRAGDGTTTGQPRAVPIVDLLSYGAKCESCDIRPAAHVVQYGGGRNHHFCEACSRKIKAGRAAKKGNIERQPGQTEKYKWILPWDTWFEQQTNHTNVKTPNDLGDIKDDEGFVGLIYADGNDVGKYIAKLSSMSAYRGFAQKMLQVNERVVAEAIEKHIKSRVNGTWPFEILTIGGDDVSLFVPGSCALEIAHDIAAGFESGMRAEGIEITTSVGVVLMAPTVPVRCAEKLAESLLNSAKKPAKKQGRSAIDFLSLKATQVFSETMEEYRRTTLTRSQEHSNTVLHLTQRPYTIDQMQQLIETCRAMKQVEFPRSQLYQLRTIMADGHMLQSVVDYLYYVTWGKRRDRASGESSYDAFESAMRKFCGEKMIYPPWRQQEETDEKEEQENEEQEHEDVHYDTALLDLIEIYPFIDRTPRTATPEEGTST